MTVTECKPSLELNDGRLLATAKWLFILTTVVFLLNSHLALGMQVPSKMDQIKQMFRLMNEVDDLTNSQPDVAIQNLRKVIEIQKKIYGSRHQAVTLETLEQIADIELGRRRWRQAMVICKEIYEKRVLDRGKDHWKSIDARLAIEECEILSKMKTAQLDELNEARRSASLGLLYYDSGDYKEAISSFENALVGFRETLGEDNREVASMLGNLAGISSRHFGDFRRAESLYSQSLKINTKILGDSHPVCSNTLGNLAALYQATGDFARAEPLYQQSLETTLRAHLVLTSEYAITLNNLSGLYQQMGDYVRAARALKQSLKIQKQTIGENHVDYAITLNNIGELYRAIKKYDEAENHLLRSWQIQKQLLGENHPNCLSILGNLAGVYHYLGDDEKAVSLFKKCLKLQKEVLGEEHLSRVGFMQNLAAVYTMLGDYGNAKTQFEKCRSIRKKILGEGHPDYIHTISDLARLYQRTGDVVQAEALAREALEGTIEILERTALVQSERQQLVMNQELRNRIDDYLSIALNSGSRFHDNGVSIAITYKGATLARQRAMRLASKAPAIKNRFGQLQEISQSLSLLSRSNPTPQQQVEWKRRMVELTNRKEKLEAEISRDSVDFRAAWNAISAQEIQESLPANVVIVDFFQYEHVGLDDQKNTWVSTTSMLATVVRPDQEMKLIELGPVRSLNGYIDKWLATKGASKEAKEAGLEIRKQIWDPLVKHVSDLETILISTDGSLGKLPFAALPGKKEDTYLIEDHRIALIPVPKLLPELVRSIKKKEAKLKLLLLGDVDYDANLQDQKLTEKNELTLNAPVVVRREFRKFNFSQLPGAAVEVDAIGGLYGRLTEGDSGGVRVLKRAEASESEFRRSAGNYHVLHLATHGYFSPPDVKSARGTAALERTGPVALTSSADVVSGMNPDLLSGLVFAGANRESTHGENDGILTSQEIAFLPLEGVETAVLSACETGLGEFAGGEGLIGIQRAFQIAGVKTTVASLWKVDDQATRKLMELFYSNLLEKSMSRLDALREAQLTILNNPESIYRSETDDSERGDRSPSSLKIKSNKSSSGRARPELWAAFQLSGDWR